MKRVARVAAARCRIGEWTDDLRELDDRSWPAVGDCDRHGVRVLRALMDEMNVEAVDVRDELVECVQSLFGGTPVELLPPVGDELFEIR